MPSTVTFYFEILREPVLSHPISTLHPVRSVTPADSGFRIKKARSHVLRTSLIEDVERGAELSFSGPLRGPCIIVKFCFQTTKFWFQTTDGQTDRRTDGRTDGQTDRRNKHILGLPS